MPAAHLTCVSATRADIDAVADDYWNAGVRHVVALRGDIPGGEAPFFPTPGGYAYAAELVEGLRTRRDFEVSVAAALGGIVNRWGSGKRAGRPEAKLRPLKATVSLSACQAALSLRRSTIRDTATPAARIRSTTPSR